MHGVGPVTRHDEDRLQVVAGKLLLFVAVDTDDLGMDVIVASKDPIGDEATRDERELVVASQVLARTFKEVAERFLEAGNQHAAVDALAGEHTGAHSDILHQDFVTVTASARLHDDLLRCPRYIGYEADIKYVDVSMSESTGVRNETITPRDTCQDS
mmetsp:Transcript_33669/g.89913  ORF Transcript_33669/g.89913 Transcript_33669/m.89913 type:complete len:157 (+) Transcript_33669:1655-2125(+)